MRNTILAGVLALGVVGGGVAVHQATSSSPQQSSSGCGVERWSVKTGTDAGASGINLNQSTWASVHSLDHYTVPAHLPSNSRISPVETTDFRLTATLVKFKQEADSDYHLVLRGGSGLGMIAEIPSPSCVGSNSPFLARIRSTRAAFDARLGKGSGTWKTVNELVTITGPGFDDFEHRQTGISETGVEIHPVLSIVFH